MTLALVKNYEPMNHLARQAVSFVKDKRLVLTFLQVFAVAGQKRPVVEFSASMGFARDTPRRKAKFLRLRNTSGFLAFQAGSVFFLTLRADATINKRRLSGCVHVGFSCYTAYASAGAYPA